MGASRAVGLNLQLGAADLTSQRFGVGYGARAGARQSDVEHVDANTFQQVKDFDLLFNGGIAHRGRLQPIAQRLVIQQNFAGRHHRAGIDRVPVVN